MGGNTRSFLVSTQRYLPGCWKEQIFCHIYLSNISIKIYNLYIYIYIYLVYIFSVAFNLLDCVDSEEKGKPKIPKENLQSTKTKLNVLRINKS